MKDARVRAIRRHPRVGEGSCASIDECWDDDAIVKTLDELGLLTPDDAVGWALEQEGLFLEQGLNARWGADDDPQLLAWKEWREHDDEESVA